MERFQFKCECFDFKSNKWYKTGAPDWGSFYSDVAKKKKKDIIVIAAKWLTVCESGTLRGCCGNRGSVAVLCLKLTLKKRYEPWSKDRRKSRKNIVVHAVHNREVKFINVKNLRQQIYVTDTIRELWMKLFGGLKFVLALETERMNCFEGRVIPHFD